MNASIAGFWSILSSALESRTGRVTDHPTYASGRERRELQFLQGAAGGRAKSRLIA